MEPGLRTPLLDFFRRGDVARDVKLMAAKGALAPRAHEQLGLLMLLINDPDPEIARSADETIAAIPRDSLAPFLARSDVSTEMRSFFATRGVGPSDVPAQEADQPLVDTSSEPAPLPGLPDLPPVPELDELPPVDPLADLAPLPELDALSELPPLPDGGDLPDLPALPALAPGAENKGTVMKIAGLGVAQRMSLAMKGTREERSILIRDPNKIVAVAVLSSPKITETEIVAIAKMASVSEEILRMIATTRAYLKNYNVVAALVRNPKTPVAMSMNLINRLNDKDLRMLSSDRNVPEIVRLTARKKIVLDKK